MISVTSLSSHICTSSKNEKLLYNVTVILFSQGLLRFAGIIWSIVIANKWSLIRNKTHFNPESYLAIWHRVWVEISRSEEERGEAIPVDRYLESYGVPLQLINDVSVQVEVGGACLCDSTAAPPLLDIATVAITDYYNSYVSSAFFIGCSVDIEMVTGYRHVRLSTWWFET